MTYTEAHDLEAALEQAIHNEMRGSRMLEDGDPRGRWHLVDAAQNYEDAGRIEDAERIRAVLYASAPEEKPAEEASTKVETDEDEPGDDATDRDRWPWEK